MSYAINVLKDAGFDVNVDSKVLDFGSGDCKLLSELHDAGYKNAIGCDIFLPDNPACNGFSEKGLVKKIEQEPYRLPFEDNSIDYIISMTVLEHVMNQEETAAELARILKPGGATFHYFPSRYQILEDHVNVPFGSIWRNYPYLLFWAYMGVRRVGEKEKKSAKEVAQFNYRVLNTTTNYLKEPEIRKVFGEHFSRVEFVEDLHFKHSTQTALQKLRKYKPYLPGMYRLYRMFKAKTLLTVK